MLGYDNNIFIHEMTGNIHRLSENQRWTKWFDLIWFEDVYDLIWFKKVSKLKWFDLIWFRHNVKMIWFDLIWKKWFSAHLWYPPYSPRNIMGSAWAGLCGLSLEWSLKKQVPLYLIWEYKKGFQTDIFVTLWTQSLVTHNVTNKNWKILTLFFHFNISWPQMVKFIIILVFPVEWHGLWLQYCGSEWLFCSTKLDYFSMFSTECCHVESSPRDTCITITPPHVTSQMIKIQRVGMGPIRGCGELKAQPPLCMRVRSPRLGQMWGPHTHTQGSWILITE